MDWLAAIGVALLLVYVWLRWVVGIKPRDDE